MSSSIRIETEKRTQQANYPTAYRFWKLMCKLTKLNNEEVKKKRKNITTGEMDKICQAG